MAATGLINVYKVSDQLRQSDLNTAGFKEILNQHGIRFELAECEDGWLIKVDYFSQDVLAEKDYTLSGKFSNKRYYLEFSQSQVPFPEKKEVPLPTKKYKGNPKAKILLEKLPDNTTEAELREYFEDVLPYGGPIQYIDVRSNNATIFFFDAKVAATVALKAPIYFNGNWIEVAGDDEVPANKPDAEVPERQVGRKTICVHNVPEDMDLELLQLYFENTRYGGGRIEKDAERDPRTSLVEITFAEEKIAHHFVKKSTVIVDDCQLKVTLKLPLRRKVLAEGKSEDLPSQSDQRTIVVHGVPNSLSPEEVKLYFENPKGAKGGPITNSDFDNRKKGIMITFDSAVVAKKVCAKKNHKLDGNPLTVSLYVPPVMEEKKVLISDIRHNISADTLKNFLEVKADSDVEDIKKIRPGIWMVSFPERFDFQKLKDVCKSESKDYLSQTYPKVRQVPVTNKVIVSNIPDQYDQEAVKDYFKDPLNLDKIVSSKMLPGRRCVLTFKDPKLASDMSMVKDTKFDLKLYNDYLDGNETYKDIPLPSPFWMKFLMAQKAVFEDELKECGNPIWSESTGNLLKILCNGDIKEEEIKKRVETLLATIHEEQVLIPSAIFEEVKEITQNDKEHFDVYFDNEKFAAHIFSFNKSKAAECQKKLIKLVESKSTAKEEIALEAYQTNLLSADFFPSKIYPKYKTLDIKIDEKKVVLCGYSTDISVVTLEMYRFLATITPSSVQLSPNAHHILKKRKVKEYLMKRMKDKNCICAWEINAEKEVLVHSAEKKSLRTAIDILKTSIVDLTFPITAPMNTTMKGDKWADFVKGLYVTYVDKFHLEQRSNELSIVAIIDVAPKIGDELEVFFDNHVTYTNTFPLQNGVHDFLKIYKKDCINKFCMDNPPTSICFNDDKSLQISGSKKGTEEASALLRSLVDKVKIRKEIFYHLGFPKFLKTHFADTMLNHISGSKKCIILKNEDIIDRNLKTSVDCQVRCASSKIILHLGDITELDVEAIVNAANKELKHIGGLAKAIVDKGGQVIQDECDRFMSNKGSKFLPEGSINVTTAGKLKCKIIVHAVGPVWQGGTHYETESLSEAITNALSNAEKTCNSIAFPAISTGIFRFPLNKATRIIVSNIKEYLETTPNTTLKSIYLVSIRQDVIDAFQHQLNAMFPEGSAIPKQDNEIPRPVKPELPTVNYDLPSQIERETPTSKTNIEIVPGLLNRIQCDVIVNTTNNSLDLSSGAISKAILADAGQGLQDECFQQKRLGPYDIAVTGGYNLPCDHVFHISLPHWSQSSQSMIKTYVANLLKKADEMGCRHVALPAFGTGALGYPIDIVSNAMFSAASEHMSDVLQKISFVIYPKDTAILQAFENVNSIGRTISDIPAYQSDIGRRDPVTSNVSQDNTYDIKGIQLIPLIGSITDQNVDGIVHGTSQQFSLSGAISKVLLSKIGQQFTNDCKTKVNEMKSNNYAITSGHKLAAKFIVHVNIEGIKMNADKVFKLCFEAAEKHQITSLALPPLGTGGLGCPVKYFTKSFLGALEDFAKSSPQHLKTVKLIIFNPPMYAEFCEELTKSQTSTYSIIKSTLKSGVSAIASRFSTGNKVKPKRTTPTNACLFFYADSTDTIDKVKMDIDKSYTSDYLSSKDIKEDTIELLSHEEKRIIDELESQHEVKIQFTTSMINVSGYKEDVGTVVEGIQSLLLSFMKRLSNKKDAENVQKLVQWSFMSTQEGKPKLMPYSKEINHKLEEAYEKQKILKMDINSRTIVFDWTNPGEMCGYPENNKKNSWKILRNDLTKGVLIPEHWDPMDNKHYLKVELKTGLEYDKVKKAFPTNFKIVKIERIQNKSLYIQYQAQLEKMKLTNPKNTKNEIEGLWHGTSMDTTEKINKTGFNRSYCGKNATAYGAGAYFAVDPQYSLSNTYSPPNANGHKHLYMCNVLAGCFTLGNSALFVLPENPQVPGLPFDSAVNDLTSPTIYITFHDANAYPAYLITCN